MKDIFKGYYRPSDDDFKKMWEEGIFVFDTNVLLNFYRYKKETKDAILDVLDKIQDRIWIPYQVGLEFHKNRLTVITEQNKVLNDFKESIKESINDIEKKYKALQLDKRHADIQAEPILKQFQSLSETVLKELDEIELKKLSNSSDEDEILNKVAELFKDKIGKKPENQEWLNNAFKEGDERAKNNIPPSFKDISKAKKEDREAYSYEGLFYKAGYGDLILWKQIIEYAKQENKKYILFITDDKKEDWMLSVSGQTISPRPELIAEICTLAEVNSFHIYNTESFLDKTKDMLKTTLPDEVIKDVAVVTKRIEKDYPYRKDENTLNIEIGIKNWLERQYEVVKELKNNRYGFDFRAYKDSQSEILIEYKISSINRIDNDFLLRIMRGINQHSLKKIQNLSYQVIIVIPYTEVLKNSMDSIKDRVYTVIDDFLDTLLLEETSFKIRFTLGSLGLSNSFQVLSNITYVL